MVMIRLNYKGTPLTFFAKNAMLDLGYDPDHESNGLSCFNQLCDVVESYGVHLFEKQEISADGTVTKWGSALLVHGHGAQWRSSSFDGEGVYNGGGPLLSVRARLVGAHGIGDPTHQIYHDQAHCYDLLVGDVYKQIPYITEVVHGMVKQVYTYFAQSPHHQRHLEKLVSDWRATDLHRKLSNLFDVRFVDSERRTLSAFLTDLPAIVASLKEELDLEDISAEKRTKLTRWVSQMSQFKFVGHLMVIGDVHTISAIFSKEAQSDANLVLDIPTFQDDAKARFRKLRTSLGPVCTRRLSTLKEGKLSMAEAGQPDRVLTIAADDSSDSDAEEVVVGVLALRGASDVKKRLQGYQKKIVDRILAGFDERVQDKAVARDLRTLFDFRRMPLQLNAQSHELLEVWGDDTVDEFLPMYFPEHDPFEFKCQALVARLYVRENQKRFMHFKDENDESKGRVLVLTGEGSVFDELFSRSDVCSKPIPLFLHVADYMIGFMWQSCCGERAGSHINLTKTKGRTDLGDETFDSLVFNTFNMPHLHEMDFEAFVKRWSDEGHQMGTTKAGMEASMDDAGEGDSREAASLVVKRHLEKKTRTFLFVK